MTGETSDNPFQYTARENDGTGLYYYRTRYFSPEMQRFISEDPIRLRGGTNYYSYVNNNPINFIDPYGLLEVTVGPNIPKNPFIDPNANKIDIFPNVPGNLDITGSVKPNNFDPKQLLNDPTAELKKLLDPNNYNWKINIEYKCKF